MSEPQTMLEKHNDNPVLNDLITKNTGEDIECKIAEVGHEDVKYKRMDNLNGPLFALAKSDILIIRYQNGTKDIFSNDDVPSKPDESVENESSYQCGGLDAVKHYTGYNSAGTTTLLITLLFSVIIGWIPAIIMSGTPPQDINLGYPNAELMKGHEYSRGYKQEAYKIKKQKVWKNFWVGCIINVVVGALIYS